MWRKVCARSFESVHFIAGLNRKYFHHSLYRRESGLLILARFSDYCGLPPEEKWRRGYFFEVKRMGRAFRDGIGFVVCFRDESLRIVHRAAFVCIGGRGGGFAGGIFPSVFQGGADIFRFAYQRACGVRDRDGGLSVVVAKPAAGYGTFLRCSVDVPPEGLAVV